MACQIMSEGITAEGDDDEDALDKKLSDIY